MPVRRRVPLFVVVCGLLVSCGTAAGGASVGGVSITASIGTDAGPPTTSIDVAPGPYPGPPAQVLEAQVVFFDPDGRGVRPGIDVEVITDGAGLEAFASRYVDGSPVLGLAARDALADGMVLVGGTISIGCVGAERALLVNTGTEVRAVGVRSQGDRDVTCVRPISSTALLAVGPDVLAGVRGEG